MPRKAKAKVKTETPAADAATPAAETWTCVECGYEHEGEEAGVAECQACGEQRPTAGAAADTEPDRFDGYVVGAVLSVEELSGKLKACSVDVGAAELTVVTNANVSEGARIVVAKARQDCRRAPKRHRSSLACARRWARPWATSASPNALWAAACPRACFAMHRCWGGRAAARARRRSCRPRSHRATGRPSAGREWTALTSSGSVYILRAASRGDGFVASDV